jgi:LysR family transcriptional regulator, low CO2-responsive transcriptional regulator
LGAVLAVSVNYQHLRAFHAIASAASVSRAARGLSLAQPTLSQQLKALEDRYHVVLFEDRKPPLRLTPAGRELFALTQRLFAASSVIEGFLKDDSDQRPISARLGSDSPIYAARMAAGLLARFPDLTIQVRIGNARETIKALTEAQVDAAIISDPPGDNRFTYEPLFSDRLMVAVPIGHPHARSRFFPLASLADTRLLVREPSSRTRIAIEHLLSQAGVAPTDVLELHTRETIREGVALGLGVGMFISSECPPDPRIAYVPLDPSVRSPELAEYVVCLTERRRTVLMRAVMESAAELRGLSPIGVDPPSPPSAPRTSVRQGPALTSA